MKREYLEELRALIDSIRNGGKERRRKSPGSRVARVRLGFLGNVPRLARAVVRVGASRRSITGWWSVGVGRIGIEVHGGRLK